MSLLPLHTEECVEDIKSEHSELRAMDFSINTKPVR